MWLPLLVWLFAACFVAAAADDQPSFSEAIAKQYWTLAYWAGASNPQACIPKKASGGFTVQNVINTKNCASIFGNAQATVSVSTDQKLVHVHFRGPDAMTTFLTLNYYRLFNKDFETSIWNNNLNVASDFATTFDGLWSAGLRTAMNDVWNEFCDFELLLTGHSIGGCLAQMMAVKMKNLGYWESDGIQLYSFSCPRCGFQDFAAAVDNSASVRYNIRYNDYITESPARNTTLCPSSSTTLDPSSPKGCFWHCCEGVKYKKPLIGSISGPTTCASGEDSNCLSGSLLDLANNMGFFSLSYSGFSPASC